MGEDSDSSHSSSPCSRKERGSADIHLLRSTIDRPACHLERACRLSLLCVNETAIIAETLGVMERMEIQELYHLLFETYAGIGILVGAGIVLSLIACVIFEFRTRKIYKNHVPDPEDDEWSLLDDVLEGEEEEEQHEAAKKKAAQ